MVGMLSEILFLPRWGLALPNFPGRKWYEEMVSAQWWRREHLQQCLKWPLRSWRMLKRKLIHGMLADPASRCTGSIPGYSKRLVAQPFLACQKILWWSPTHLRRERRSCTLQTREWCLSNCKTGIESFVLPKTAAAPSWCALNDYGRLSWYRVRLRSFMLVILLPQAAACRAWAVWRLGQQRFGKQEMMVKMLKPVPCKITARRPKICQHGTARHASSFSRKSWSGTAKNVGATIVSCDGFGGFFAEPNCVSRGKAVVAAWHLGIGSGDVGLAVRPATTL